MRYRNQFTAQLPAEAKHTFLVALSGGALLGKMGDRRMARQSPGSCGTILDALMVDPDTNIVFADRASRDAFLDMADRDVTPDYWGLARAARAVAAIEASPLFIVLTDALNHLFERPTEVDPDDFDSWCAHLGLDGHLDERMRGAAALLGPAEAGPEWKEFVNLHRNAFFYLGPNVVGPSYEVPRLLGGFWAMANARHATATFLDPDGPQADLGDQEAWKAVVLALYMEGDSVEYPVPDNGVRRVKVTRPLAGRLAGDPYLAPIRFAQASTTGATERRCRWAHPRPPVDRPVPVSIAAAQ